VNQLMSRVRIVALCFCAVLFASCGGGGDGGPPPGPDLTGTWFGTLEDPSSVMHTTSVTISGTTITEIRVDNVPTGRTGTITPQTSSQAFAFTLNDGTKGGFFLDSSLAHAGFVDNEFNFGVVQKGATAVPAYANADITGSWSGIIAVTSDFNKFGVGAPCPPGHPCAWVNMTCTHPTCDIGVGHTMTLGSVDSLGRYQAVATTFGSEGVAAFLSPDKQFTAGYYCSNLSSFPQACQFMAWRKQ
jgi:hypothetical protein